MGTQQRKSKNFYFTSELVITLFYLSKNNSGTPNNLRVKNAGQAAKRKDIGHVLVRDTNKER